MNKTQRKLSLKSNKPKPFSSDLATMPCALSIAGSDPTGAAGVHADLRSFAALRVHGLGVIAAVTAQNSHCVLAAQPVSPQLLRRQLRALADDFNVAAIKIGMLGSAANIREVAAFIRDQRARNVVLDPVLASSSGTLLLPATAKRALVELFPLVDLITPNRPEAAALLDRTLPAARLARALLDLGSRAVLLKGGHGRGSVVIDYFADADGVREIRHPRLPFDARGTGCVLSSAITAYLARGLDVAAAVDAAENFLQQAMRESVSAGRSAKRFLLIANTTNK